MNTPSLSSPNSGSSSVADDVIIANTSVTTLQRSGSFHFKRQTLESEDPSAAYSPTVADEGDEGAYEVLSEKLSDLFLGSTSDDVEGYRVAFRVDDGESTAFVTVFHCDETSQHGARHHLIFTEHHTASLLRNRAEIDDAELLPHELREVGVPDHVRERRPAGLRGDRHERVATESLGEAHVRRSGEEAAVRDGNTEESAEGQGNEVHVFTRERVNRTLYNSIFPNKKQ